MLKLDAVQDNQHDKYDMKKEVLWRGISVVLRRYNIEQGWGYYLSPQKFIYQYKMYT